MASRTTKPPKKPPTVSGPQKRYKVGEPNPEAETLIPCPLCRKGMVPVSIATAVKDAMSRMNNDPIEDDDTKNGTE